MARFCVVVVIAVCCQVTGSCGDDDAAVTRKCSVERSGVLTMFNGQTSTVAVPCKYRLADIQCGDYHLQVTPGSQLDSNNTFSPYRVFVKMQKTGLAGHVWVKTTSRRLRKFAEGKVEKAWSIKRGNLSSFGLDLAGYDSAKQAAVLRKDGVFHVEFIADRVVVRCFSDSFFSMSQPDTLCGDGEPGDAATKEEILDMVFTNTEVFQRPRPSCPRAVSVYQQCPAAYAHFTRVCNEILLQQATVDCLAGSDTPLIVHYHRCLLAGCRVDMSAFDPTIAYIIDNNCVLDPGSDCSTATFVGCDSNSTCEGGAICKHNVNQTCASFSDHCANGAICDPDTKICVTEDTDWLKRRCSADTDCPAARQSTCFEGLCLCTPGYYYSVGQNTCVEVCAQSDLQETFLKYPGSGIADNNIFESEKDTEEDCMEWCRNVTECRTVEYNSWGNYCYLQSKTALDVPVSYWVTGVSTYNLYQKMCA